MCNTAPTGPAPHIEPGSARPDTARTTGDSLKRLPRLQHELRTAMRLRTPLGLLEPVGTISAPRMRPRTRPPIFGAGDSARRRLRR